MCYKMNQRYMLLMACSRIDGFGYLEHAKEQLKTFLNKKKVKTVLFVPYAFSGYDKYTHAVRKALTTIGFSVEGLHTKPNVIEAVRAAEAIFVGGGNTFVLLKDLYDKQLVEVIREQVLKGGLPYIGSSAGTNVATQSIHTTNVMPMAYPPTFDALKLIPFNINAHYVETHGKSQQTRDERLDEFLEYHQRAVLGLREGTSLFVETDKATLLGPHNAKLFQPNAKPKELPPNSDLSFLLNN